MGITKCLILFLEYSFSKFVESVTKSCPFCFKYSSIFSLGVSINGRIILPLFAGIEQSPFKPVPLAILKISVSATSSRLCAVAIFPPKASFSKISYRFSLANSSKPFLAFFASETISISKVLSLIP